jgi:hypothetical protein
MLIDLHIHTKFGSSCSYLHPRDLAQRAREIGLDGVCITEHNVCWAEEDLEALSREGCLLVVGGVEVDTEVGEFVVFGIPQLSWNSFKAEELRRLVDSSGGVMIATHPFRQDRLLSSDVDEVCRRPVFALADAVEVFNGLSSRWEIDFACKVLERLKLRGVGGSDAHALHTVGLCATLFERRIQNQQEFIRELKAGRFRALHRALDLIF